MSAPDGTGPDRAADDGTGGEVVLPEGAARADYERLYAAALTHAIGMIHAQGTFVPFALTLGPTGQSMGEVRPDLGPRRGRQTADQVVAQVREQLEERAAAGEVRCSVLLSDVRLLKRDDGGVPDAVRLELEHRDAEPLTLAVPYTPEAGEADEPALHPALALPAERHVFPPR